MDSPPSCSAWSTSDILSSDDSGLLLTSGHSGSISSTSSSGFCHIAMELQESDEDKSTTSPWGDDNFDTLKRVWTISPPPEFQDPPSQSLENLGKFAAQLVSQLVKEALLISSKITWSIPCSQECHMSDVRVTERHVNTWSGVRLCWTPEMHPYSPCHGAKSLSRVSPYSPCHGGRPGSRVSLSSSRLSSSHNSLSVPAHRVDDSSFITSAMSHDTLSSVYNVPYDSDIYAVPVDAARKEPPPVRPRRPTRRRALDAEYNVPVSSQCQSLNPKTKLKLPSRVECSVSVERSASEPIHMTLQEVRQYLHTLYSNESVAKKKVKHFCTNTLKNDYKKNDELTNTRKNKKNGKKKKEADLQEEKGKKINNFSTNIKRTLCNIFQFKKLASPEQCLGKRVHTPHSDEIGVRLSCHIDKYPPSPITKPPFPKRALPPLPPRDEPETLLSVTADDVVVLDEPSLDFASSIEKVKDYGWYWGPISGEAAEKILSNEPDGSFIVRDSSDDYYIFSLTFKLNSIVRHVRIEHDQGNFSFGSSTRFKSHTIVDFIESAVEHSRSGRYLFFLHRRPVLGPMRVQLLHPVSRFKHVQSLQHMCRFVILKLVRRDLIHELPLPRRLIDYLSTPHYYTENLVVEDETEMSS